MTHGQCDARLTVTFPVAERYRPLTGTKLYCLVTEAQLAQSCYLVADWPGVELATFRSRANALTTEPPSHPGRIRAWFNDLLLFYELLRLLISLHSDWSVISSIISLQSIVTIETRLASVYHTHVSHRTPSITVMK